MSSYKYFLGLAAIMKNEGTILREFVAHYRNQGVQHFYFINNDSTDDTVDILKDLEAEGVVTAFHDASKHSHVRLLNTYFPIAIEECEWIVNVDLDEFMYTRTDGGLAHFLHTHVPHDVMCVYAPWKMFGSSGHITQPASVINGFTRRTPCQNTLIKSITRSSAMLEFDIHTHQMRSNKAMNGLGMVHDLTSCFQPNTEEMNTGSVLQLNHYPIQSFDWFKRVKMTRGDARDPTIDTFRNEEYFHRYNENNTVIDEELSHMTT
jgi:glycosyltransferase involved in cell wall biosynthesis